MRAMASTTPYPHETRKSQKFRLAIVQTIALKRAQYAIQTLIGLMISEATTLKYVMPLHQALARWEQTAIERLLTEPALHVDGASFASPPAASL